MTTLSLASLIVEETKEAIYTRALSIANAIGLPVTSWLEGDPTRSTIHVEAEELSALESLVAGFIRSGFLDFAKGMWLKILAKQVFNVDVPEATFATCDVLMTNNGGGLYPDIAAGDLTFKNTTTGKTYHNTTGGTLASGPATTLTVTVVADEAGSDSSAGAGEIDNMVTQLLGVTCANALAGVGIDEQDESTTIAQCRDKLGALSPNGPREAYSFVARSPELSGTNAVTRVRVYSDSSTGDVTVYLAGPGGGVAEADRVLVETAIARYATPLCITATTLAASDVAVPVTYELWVYKRCNKTAAEVEADVEDALEQMFATRAIGGDIIAPATTGKLYQSMIESTIRSVFATDAFRVSVSLPATDTTLTNGQVATLGTVTATINLVVDP